MYPALTLAARDASRSTLFMAMDHDVALVRKVANNIKHDETHLGNRATTLSARLRSSRLEMKGLFELSGLTKDVMTADDNETSSGLFEMVDVVLGQVQPNPQP